MNVLSSVDRAALAGYCQAYGRWVEAEEKLQSTGLIIKSPSGYPIHNPYLDIATRAMKELRSFAVEFGLTPSARTRLNMFSQPREQHPLGKLRFFQPAGTNGA
jgi:P27 family predicted phage terminase small subunit